MSYTSQEKFELISRFIEFNGNFITRVRREIEKNAEVLAKNFYNSAKNLSSEKKSRLSKFLHQHRFCSFF